MVNMSLPSCFCFPHLVVWWEGGSRLHLNCADLCVRACKRCADAGPSSLDLNQPDLPVLNQRIYTKDKKSPTMRPEIFKYVPCKKWVCHVPTHVTYTVKWNANHISCTVYAPKPSTINGKTQPKQVFLAFLMEFRTLRITFYTTTTQTKQSLNCLLSYLIPVLKTEICFPLIFY